MNIQTIITWLHVIFYARVEILITPSNQFILYVSANDKTSAWSIRHYQFDISNDSFKV